VLMQLGDGGLMSSGSSGFAPDTGVGINLIWTSVGGIQETLSYRPSASLIPITQTSKQTNIKVLADLDSQTYSVLIGGVEMTSRLPFTHPVDFNSVRFLIHGVGQANFDPRCFDILFLGTP